MVILYKCIYAHVCRKWGNRLSTMRICNTPAYFYDCHCWIMYYYCNGIYVLYLTTIVLFTYYSHVFSVLKFVLFFISSFVSLLSVTFFLFYFCLVFRAFYAFRNFLFNFIDYSHNAFQFFCFAFACKSSDLVDNAL